MRPNGFLETPADARLIARMTETVALAFNRDPTWSPVVESRPEDPTVALRYWEFFVRAGQRYHSWTGCVEDAAAVSIWIPPGGEEFDAEEEARFPGLAAELLGEERTAELFRIIERFDDARPPGDYFYLSLLATHPSRRGEGLGMGLLAANLERLDELGVPSYLESSNSVNDERYARLGYRPRGTIVLPSGLELTTMWRDPGTPGGR